MIYLILFVSAAIRIWLIQLPTIVFWDSAMYIGIGKYIFTHGAIGVWEPFRPLLLPLILGTFWKIGFDPLIVGKILQVLWSLIAIWIIYRIGEKIQKYVGLIASVLLGFSPVFIAYSALPLTDIVSIMCALLALYAYLNNRFVISGLWVAAAFGFRFPHSLVMIALGLSVISTIPFISKEKIRIILKLAAGFIIGTLPFFIYSTIVFHNPIRPITWANQVYTNSGTQEPHNYLFYIKGLQEQNPFLVFAALGIGLILYRFIKSRTKKSQVGMAVLFNLIIIGGYFSFSAAHKELRYGLAFLPYIALLAGVGIIWFVDHIRFKYTPHIVTIILGAVLIYASHIAYVNNWAGYQITPAQARYEAYFSDKGTPSILTSSPYYTAYSNAQIYNIMATWEEAQDEYAHLSGHPDYVAFNDCELTYVNDTTGPAAKDAFLAQVSKERQEVFHETSHLPQRSCELYIFK